jgi:hypothetical protein
MLLLLVSHSFSCKLVLTKCYLTLQCHDLCNSRVTSAVSEHHGVIFEGIAGVAVTLYFCRYVLQFLNSLLPPFSGRFGRYVTGVWGNIYPPSLRYRYLYLPANLHGVISD